MSQGPYPLERPKGRGMDPSHNNQNYELIEFDKIKWEELFSDAKNIDIFVHYFDT